MTDFIPVEITEDEKARLAAVRKDLEEAFDESEIARLEVEQQDLFNEVSSRLGMDERFLAPYEGETKQFILDIEQGGYRVQEPVDTSNGGSWIKDVLGVALPVLSVLPTPLAPAAQFAMSAQNVVSGDGNVGDLLTALGAAGISNPLSAVTDQVNTTLGLEGDFRITDDVTSELAQGDVEGAALEYANTGMLPDIDTDSAIGDVLAAFDDTVLQPLSQFGNELLDPLQDVIDPITGALAGLDDSVIQPLIAGITSAGSIAGNAIIQPAVQAASVVDDSVIQPVISGIGTAGSIVDDAVIQPVVQAASAIDDNVTQPIAPAAGALEDVVSEAIPSTSIDLPEVNISRIAQLFNGLQGINVPAVTFSDSPSTTESLFGDLFKFDTEITRV